jgi:hypothetical protein
MLHIPKLANRSHIDELRRATALTLPTLWKASLSEEQSSSLRLVFACVDES